MSLKHIEGNKD